MAYTKQTWTNDVTAITAERMTHIENGIYDNSLATDKINPSGTATTTAEIEAGQINDVIGFKSLKLKGHTSQETYEGYNIFDGVLLNNSYNPTTGEIEASSTSSRSNKLTAESNQSYYFSGITGNVRLLYWNNDTYVSSEVISAPNTFTAGGNKIAFQFDKSLTYKDIQIAKGTTQKSYEPYTGGKASPNPDFPQDVKNVSGYNVVAINGSKNLFDKDINIVTPGYLNASGAVVTSDATLSYQNRFIKVQPSTVYTISSGTNTIYRIAEYTSDKTFIARTLNANASRSYSFATSSQTHYIKMAGTLTTVLNTLQIEKGNTATSYVAHQGNNFEINLGKNLFNEKFRQGNASGLTDTKNIFNETNKLLKTGTYTFSTNIPSTMKFAIFGNTQKFPTSNTVTYNSTFKTGINTFTFTLSQDLYFGLMIANNDSSQIAPSDVNEYYFQLEKGAIATTYAPYFEPILLGSLGTKTNDIRRKDGKWYWHKEMRKATYNGSEDWRSNMTWDGNVGDETMHFYINTVSDWLIGQTEYKSEKFIGTTQNNRNLNVEEMTCHTSASSLYVFLKATRIGATSENTEAERVALLKAWLANNNFSVYYQLLTPVDEEITYAPLLRQLDELYNSGLYDNTNISQDNSSEAFILDLEACKNNINGIVEYIRR